MKTIPRIVRTEPYYENCFQLNSTFVKELYERPYEFGHNGFGYVVYKRTYSRTMDSGKKEEWPDTIKRVVEGVFSIRKSHYLRNNIPWNETRMQEYAKELSIYMFDMKFLPAGRGLSNMGSELVRKHGSICLNNCSAIAVEDFVYAVTYTMHCLSYGCGGSYDTITDMRPHSRNPDTYVHVIEDTKEGWADSVTALLYAYFDDGKFPLFDYSRIRPEGTPLKTSGGIASGPEPLMILHRKINAYINLYLDCVGKTDIREIMVNHAREFRHEFYMDDDSFEKEVVEKIRAHPEKTYGMTRLIVDIMNAVGVCIVSGGQRRSALISLGEPGDVEFINLKNYELNPERQPIGWMSNNSIRLSKTEHFSLLPQIADLIRNNGEPGVLNLKNMRKGRIGHSFNPDDIWTREQEEDTATHSNACSEVCLDGRYGELCNLGEVFPTMCENMEEFLKAVEFCTFYCSTVALVETEWEKTNEILRRNRRIGVSLSGIADWISNTSMTEVIKATRIGYKKIREVNTRLAKEAGVVESLRVTVVKPSGTVSLLPKKNISPGIHYPAFKFYIRRIRINKIQPICEVLIRAGIKHYDDPDNADSTYIFEFVSRTYNSRSAEEVSIFEQLGNVAALSNSYVDQMVSVTVYFSKEREGECIETSLGIFMPFIKNLSYLPHTPAGVYKNPPYEGITEEEYERRKDEGKFIDWSSFSSEHEENKYCDGDKCML